MENRGGGQINQGSRGRLFSGRHGKNSALLRGVSLLFFPILFADLVFWRLADPHVYDFSLMEDGPLEYVTFWCLLAAAMVALLNGWQMVSRGAGRRRWFYQLVALFGLLVALEEISWGQRMMGVASPSFFVRNSTQEEINVHNVLQKWTGIKFKHLAGCFMLLYGVVLPFLPTGHRLRAPLDRRGIPIPPRFLAVGFFMGAGAMVDLPSGREEEIGECFFSICLLIFMAHERLWNGQMRGIRPDPARRPAELNAVADRS